MALNLDKMRHALERSAPPLAVLRVDRPEAVRHLAEEMRKMSAILELACRQYAEAMDRVKWPSSGRLRLTSGDDDARP